MTYPSLPENRNFVVKNANNRVRITKLTTQTSITDVVIPVGRYTSSRFAQLFVQEISDVSLNYDSSQTKFSLMSTNGIDLQVNTQGTTAKKLIGMNPESNTDLSFPYNSGNPTFFPEIANADAINPEQLIVALDLAENQEVYLSQEEVLKNILQELNLDTFNFGFRTSAVSEGVPFMSGPRYGYISIDDHQTNSKSEFQVVYADSIHDDNIIARINLAPRSVHTMSLRDTGMASLLNRTRTYQGPVNIQKLTVKLYDEYGRIIDLNNTDWSFTLEFEKETKELISNES